MKKTLALAIAVLGMACGTAGVVPDAPTIAATDKEVVWVTRGVQIFREDGSSYRRQGLFACYRPPVEKAGEPVCYLAKYSVDGATVGAEDLAFPDGPRVRKAKAGKRTEDDDD